MFNILFSSVGRRVSLINIFRKAASELGVNSKIIAVDMDPSWSPACKVADIACQVPTCTAVDFIPSILEICRKHDISLIVPTIDTELMVYSKNRKLFEEIGVNIHVSESNFIAIARDKAATCQLLKQNHIPTPNSWTLRDLQKVENIPFPLFIKPKDGSCSKGISIISSYDELHEKIGNGDNWLIQEVCSGREYTVNCFYNRNGNCVACIPHFRKFVRDGEVCFAQTERIPEFTAIADQFSHIFKGIQGVICFQGFKRDDGSVQVFEINARFGGGYPICDHAGGTFARWILQELLGETPDYNDNWSEGIRMLRYDAAVFTKVKE
jgi:carbamoyl-phosphate synthase large subunit